MSFKISSFLRFIYKSGIYFLVNITGLSLAIAIMLIAILFIYRELSTDRFHSQIKSIYCVAIDGRASTPFMYAELIKDKLPGVNDFTRVQFWDLKFNVLRYGDNPPVDLDQIIRADTNFFSFFDFRFVSGDPATCLGKPESLVLTESSVRKLFGSEDPIGKQVSYNKGQILLTVTAVVEDPPYNSSIKFNAVMSVNSLPVIYPPFSQPGAFFWNFETFVILNGITPGESLKSTASELLKSSIPSEAIKEAQDIFKSKFEVRFIPFSKVYFNKEFQTALRKGDIKQVYLFSLIGFLILLVALVNYVNLSNAVATARIKEVMIRKTMGASKSSLFFNFMGESVLQCFVAMLFALILGNILTNFINQKEVLTVPLEFFNLSYQLILLIAGSLLTGFAGGIYPALNLAGLNPSTSKKHMMLSKAVMIRKILLSFQFFITACLLICAIVISRQYKIMTENPSGFNSENILFMRMGRQLKSSYQPFADRLRNMPQVIAVANARYGFIGGRNPALAEFLCNGQNVNIDAISFTTDTGFMELLGLTLAGGSSFREHDNIAHKLIINETALKHLGNYGSLSGITLPDKVHGITWQVVGVVKDFSTRSMQYPVSPYVFYFTPGDADMDGLYIKIRNDADISETLDMIKKTSFEFSPDEPVNPELLEDVKALIYKEDNNRKKMFRFFSVFTMLISGMGLYALSGFILGRRTREAGIRQVFGAGKKSVFVLLSSGLIKIVIMGYLLAVPVSWYLMSKWLQGFELKTNLAIWIFLITGLSVYLVALLSVSSEILKISSKKIAEIIRYE